MSTEGRRGTNGASHTLGLRQECRLPEAVLGAIRGRGTGETAHCVYRRWRLMDALSHPETRPEHQSVSLFRGCLRGRLAFPSTLGPRPYTCMHVNVDASRGCWLKKKKIWGILPSWLLSGLKKQCIPKWKFFRGYVNTQSYPCKQHRHKTWDTTYGRLRNVGS